MAVAIPNSHNLHSTVTERLQKYYRIERTAYKNTTNENGLYTAASAIHSGYCAR